MCTVSVRGRFTLMHKYCILAVFVSGRVCSVLFSKDWKHKSQTHTVFFPQRCKKKQKNSSIKEPQMDVRQRLQFVDQVIKANMLNNSRWITDRWNNVPSKRKITGFTSLSIKGLRALFNSPNASSGLVGISSVWRNFSVLWTFFYRTQTVCAYAYRLYAYVLQTVASLQDICMN